MAIDTVEAAQDRVPQAVYRQLEQAAPQERAEIVLRLIEEHPMMLELPARDDIHANLREVDLSRETLKARLARLAVRSAPWWNSYFDGADLQFANLQGAHLDSANLQGACLNGANLQEAKLTEVNLQDARLMGADLQRAGLASALLAGAHLYSANLEGASLANADLQGVDLRNASLQNADLTAARLQRVDLSSCNLTHIYVSGAWLDRTKLSRRQLGERIGEERDAEDTEKPPRERAHLYWKAKEGYVALKQNFDDLGDYDGTSWAYRKERRMRKKEAWQNARLAFSERRWSDAVRNGARYINDQYFVELICDYGESAWRVVMALVALFVVSTLGYGFSCTIVRDSSTVCLQTSNDLGRDLITLAHFSLGAMSTIGPTELETRYEMIEVLARLQGLLGIALTGLLGFVVGNRIRRS